MLCQKVQKASGRAPMTLGSRPPLLVSRYTLPLHPAAAAIVVTHSPDDHSVLVCGPFRSPCRSGSSKLTSIFAHIRESVTVTFEVFGSTKD